MTPAEIGALAWRLNHGPLDNFFARRYCNRRIGRFVEHWASATEAVAAQRDPSWA
jgi:hypothetical protein